MKVHLFLMVGLTLAGCAPSMPGDSAGDDRLPPPLPVAPPVGVHRMIENPDAEVTEVSEEVWATDEAQAMQKCQNLAESRTKESGTLVTVQGRPRQTSVTPSSRGSFRFVCTLRAEQ